MSLSGKTMPQSTRIMSPWHSYSVVFLAHFPQAAQGDNLHRHSAFPAGRGPAPLSIAARHAPARGRLHRRGHGCICHLACPLCCFRPLCAARSGGRLALLVWARAALGRLDAQGPGPCLQGHFSVFHSYFSSMFRTPARHARRPPLPRGTKRRRPGKRVCKRKHALAPHGFPAP